MKKTYGLVTLILAALTVVCAILNPILTDNAPFVSWAIAAILSISAAAMWAVPTFMKNRMLTIIPVLALYAVSDYLKTMLIAVLSQTSSELVDTLPSYYEFETLDLVLTAVFIIAMVFVFKKGCKWATIAATAYSSIMLICQVQLFLTYSTAASAFDDAQAVAALVFMALSFVFAFATQVTMFLGIDTEAKEEAPAEEPEKIETPAETESVGE